jgi:4'-phosphopantetheinyl transferase
LADYLGRTPAELGFDLYPGGKPRVHREAGEIDLRFSLSHSHKFALVAVANGREVGVDIERVDARTKVLRIAERYFTREEAEVLRALPAAARVEGFFRCWTLKEAYLKALGGGLRLALDSFSVSLTNHGPAHLLWSAHDDARCWTLHTLTPAEPYVAAVVIEGEIEELEIRDWRSEPAT